MDDHTRLPPSPQQSSGRRRGGAPTRADRPQLADSPVSLRRIARSSRRYRGQPGRRRRRSSWLSSLVGLAPPFLVRHVIDEALPQPGRRACCCSLVGAMVAVAVVTAVLGVVQTWLSTAVGQRVMHGLRTAVFAHLQRQSLGFFTRTRGGEVQSRLDQRHRRHAARRHLDRDLDRLQRHHRRRHRRRHGRAVSWRLVAALAASCCRRRSG